jgi:hypothetical protein
MLIVERRAGGIQVTSEEKVIQIMPGTGWLAVYYRSEAPYFEESRLVMWAIIEDTAGNRRIAALDTDEAGHLNEVQQAAHFLTFAHMDDSSGSKREELSERGRTASTQAG